MQKEQELARGYGGGPIAWKQFCDRYKLEAQAKLKPKSRSDWETVRISLTAYLQPRLLQDVTAEAISRWQAYLVRQKKSPDTIAKYLRTLSRALTWAADLRLIDAPPYIAKVKRTRSSRAMKGRPITRDEFRAMVNAVDEVQEIAEDARESWRHVLHVVWYSGIRLEEIPKLSWDEDGDLAIIGIDQRRPMLRVRMEHEKGGRDRLIGLTPDLVEYLRRTPKAERCGSVCKPLVRTQDKRQPLRESSAAITIGKRISDIGEAAGVVVNRRGDQVKHATAHDLRRSFGTRWASRVVPAVLKELMRHASIRTTEQYYVELHAEQTADAVWNAFGPGLGDPLGDP